MRTARADDAEFLLEMLVETVNWDPARPALSRADVVARPELFHYIEGWPRPGDAGVIAEDPSGSPVGAAWYRQFGEADPGYGFVEPTVPEVAIGVVPALRGRGLGRSLLRHLHAVARQQGLRALSLSVESGNPAKRLYERAGYVVVTEDDGGGGVTMLVDLAGLRDRLPGWPRRRPRP